MIRSVFLLFLSALIFSCNRKQPDASLPTPAPLAIPETTDSALSSIDGHFFWSSDLGPNSGLIMKKVFPITKDSLSVPDMINRLNDQYPEIQLKLKRFSHDTVFVKIDKSAYLTQQMGSSGAEAYLAEVTFNLTEPDGINAVYIGFKTGDHAGPGVYTRTDFINELKK